MEVTRWRKSSRSEGANTCVEVRLDAIRDSKNPTGPALSVDLTGMVTVVKAGRLDR